MNAKEIIIDFINYLFMLIIIIFFFYFFVLGNRVGLASEIMKKIIPLGFFGIILLIKLKFSREQIKRKKIENDFNITLILSYFDKLKIDAVIFSLPIIIFLIAFFGDGVDMIDAIQALASFLIVFTLNKYIFSKAC